MHFRALAKGLVRSVINNYNRNEKGLLSLPIVTKLILSNV